MLPGEIKATGRLAGDAIAGPAGLARDVQRAVSGRVFGVLGMLGAPARFGHDAITTAVYRSVHAAVGFLPRRAGAAVAELAPPQAQALAESVAGSIGLGALNGAIGDLLDREHRDLALSLSIRHRGEDLLAEPRAAGRIVPDPSRKLAVFVHGLCETDAAWQLLPLSGRRPDRRSYGSRLRDEHGYTPLYVRYNSGRHVSDNGRLLAAALERLTASWPVEVEEITLIGHSMGGLVSRSACHYGGVAEQQWAAAVRHVVCLGTPHLGAPLERAANVGGWALTRLPETRPFARLINGRSAGIKDLRFGSCLEEDWCDCDPDEYLTDRCNEVPFLEHAAYYFVGATIARDPRSRLGRVVGDALVQYPSASGAGPTRRVPFDIENGMHLGGANHMQLLNHPAVYERIEHWITGAENEPLQQVR